ncbi:extracellular solute-binding protein [Cohnella phaseoli]|uniref:Putative aldouronate transport system substrate-binding protein n=1 Tax=Cohnella phaseoli TaxID=456490 RepID=A0A3D9IUL9_9BACL|nr:extracellular solute-binding protein [Cohnella phaseoli]RED65460.1 putative aldouronate transport system substrate-binding protein [Cohnella phaseoli]
MKRTAKYFGMSLAVLTIFMTAACGNESKGGNAQESGSPAATASSQASTAAPESASTETVDPFGKYDPPIKVSVTRNTDSTYKFKEGESFDKNAWNTAYAERLGIQIANKWIVQSDQYDQKMNASIAAGDLPDVFRVNAVQFKQLADAGQLEDLTEVYEKYASPMGRELIENGQVAKAASTVGGKLLAIPQSQDYFGGAPLLWVRTDWLVKLGLPEPSTMQDVFTIAEAFTKQDPDGNGKADTLGLALSKELFSGYPDVTGFMNGFHAYPKIWIKDASGKLVYGSIQPEVKAALAKLQEMFNAGQIDKEFGVKDGSKASELEINGKLGMHFGAMWNPLWPLQGNKDKEPQADWKAYPIPSIDGNTANAQSSLDYNQFWVVRKGYEHPEAVIKLYNLTVDIFGGDSQNPEIYHSKDGIEFHKYALLTNTGTGEGLIGAQKHIKAAFESGDASKLTAEEKGYYDKIVAHQGGDNSGWGTDRVFGSESAYSVIGQYYDQNRQLKVNEFIGAPTPTMGDRRATLEKLELETFTKIILGASLDDFDTFVADWKKLGGDQITAEVNEWYATK